MRQRHVLQVTTVPFLAVLLCAMGALILLLLVIDRRAKAVARAKAMQLVERRAAEEAEAVARRQAELEQRRQALYEQLREQDQDLMAQVQAAQGRAEGTAKNLQAEQAHLTELRQRIKAMTAQIAQGQEAMKTRTAEIGQTAAQTQESQRELARMTDELLRLEKTLADLKAIRARDQETYSLVPYRGKRGDNRRPIYVECAATGVVFHPDRQMLEGSDLAARLRREVEGRIARRRTAAAGATEETPYLLFLVRPAGIMLYFRALAALDGMKVDFGYEFVEADWAFDFPENEDAAPQPWMTPARDAKSAKSAQPTEPSRGVANLPASGTGAAQTPPPTSGHPAGNGEGWTPRSPAANLGRPSSDREISPL